MTGDQAIAKALYEVVEDHIGYLDAWGGKVITPWRAADHLESLLVTVPARAIAAIEAQSQDSSEVPTGEGHAPLGTPSSLTRETSGDAPATSPSIYEGTPLPHGIECRCSDCDPASRQDG